MRHLALAFQRTTVENAGAAGQTTASHNERERERERRNLVPQLRQLAEQLAAKIHAGSAAQARRLAHQYMLPPIAWGFLAACLQQQGVPAEEIVGVLS